MRHIGFGFALLFLLCVAQVQAAEDRLAVERIDKDREVYKGLTVDKKFTKRLPTGYREIVSNSQREEIYKIQQEYFETIELLKARIELLESERNLKIANLLNDEQRGKLKNPRRGNRGQEAPAPKAPAEPPSVPTPSN